MKQTEATECSKPTNTNKWEQGAGAYKTSIKFPPKLKALTIFPTIEPKVQSIDGKYGKRDMYLVETDIGTVALTPAQLTDVFSIMQMRGDFEKPVVWTKQ